MIDIEAKLKVLPKLHVWMDGEQNPYVTSGGFEIRHLKWISDLLDKHITDYQNSSVVETGAGLSTILFLLKGFGSVTSIAPDLLLERNITRWCALYQVDAKALHFLTNRAEYELPRMVDRCVPHNMIDVALIDGDHGWPNVFVDFCYINIMLKTGGIVIFDDCNVYPVAECVNFLSEEAGWEKLDQWSKMTAFRRKSSEKYTSGAGRRYLQRKTEEMKAR